MEQIFNENKELLDSNKIEFLSNLGSEYIVYKYQDLVLKIYRKYYGLSHLSLEELNTLINVSTQRILLPTGTLWNRNQELIGYQMPFITGERCIDGDSVYSFFEELEILKQDLDVLCSNYIILRDINLSNTIYNGHIFLIDPGNYLIDRLDKIIFQMDITDLSIEERLKKIIIENDYRRIKFLIDSLSLEEKQKILECWNYNKINELIDMLLFWNVGNTNPFLYRQILQFIRLQRNKNGFIYSLDVLKLFFDKELSIREAIDNFIKEYIKDDFKERKLFLSLY